MYFALSQANTDTETFALFMRDLVRILNVENRRWREKTLIWLDGAPYHQSEEIMKVYDELNIPICISAAHSYDTAPCELFFAAFKSGHINPQRVQTGKR